MAFKTSWLQAGTYNAINDRIVAGLYLAQGSNPLSGEGWVAGGMLTSARPTPNWSVDVSAGRALVPTPASDGGAYSVLSDAVDNVVVPSVSTLPRRDLIILEVQDPDYAGAVSAPRFRCVAGTPAASPVYPALPSGAVQLAKLNHLANAVSVAAAAIVEVRSVGHPDSRGPLARLNRTSKTDLLHNVLMPVPWQAAVFDTHSGWSAGSNPTRWTCPANWGGFYRLGGIAAIGPQGVANGAGVRFAQFNKNGAYIPWSNVRHAGANDAFQTAVHVASIVQLVPGDYVEMIVAQTSNYTLEVYWDGSGYGSSMDVEFVRRV